MLVKINVCILLFSNDPRTLFLLLKIFFSPKQRELLILVQFQNTQDNRHCNLPTGKYLIVKQRRLNLLKNLLSSQGDKSFCRKYERWNIPICIHKQVFTVKNADNSFECTMYITFACFMGLGYFLNIVFLHQSLNI